jgi:hypothetical protein
MSGLYERKPVYYLKTSQQGRMALMPDGQSPVCYGLSKKSVQVKCTLAEKRINLI